MFEPVHKLLEKTTLLRKTNITIPFNSLFKSNLVIFKKKSPKTPFPRLLLLNSLPIPFTDIVKFFVLIFHDRHSWHPHIKAVKAKCLRALNVLKYLSHPSSGCNRKILLPLYNSLIRSMLDYGSPIYGLAPPSHLAFLDLVQNSAIRICSGAFHISPALSLCAESGYPPLHYRRLNLTASLLTSSRIPWSMTCSSIPYVTVSPIASHSPTFDISSIILSPKTSTFIAYPA